MRQNEIPIGTAEDLTGKTYGKLTVLYRVQNNSSNRGAKWRCKCECGNVTEVLAANLKKGHTLSCGCLQKEKTSKSHFQNEVGNKYGRLTVIERAEDSISKSGRRATRWKCLCDCGNETIVHSSALRQGLTISCGCYQKEQISNRCNEKYIGKTFHYITILRKNKEKASDGESLWECKCNLCGKTFPLRTSHLKTQISCGCLKESYGVTVIKSLLTNNNIDFKTEHIFNDCIFTDSGKPARFDFYVENKYLIEFDGEQHYSFSGGWNTKEQMEATQKRDREKDKWCLKNNIPIIRIPYWEIHNLTIEDLRINSRFLVTNVRQMEDET